MFCHFSEYCLGIMKMDYHDIIEIDTLNELAVVDNSYAHYIAPKEVSMNEL